MKLTEIMWKNKLGIVVVLCFFIYEVGELLEQPSWCVLERQQLHQCRLMTVQQYNVDCFCVA